MRRLTQAILLAVFAAAATSAQSPAVVIVWPGAQDFVTGVVVLKARIEPPSRRPAKVTFFADGRHVCTIDQPRLECQWDAGTTLAEHQIRVVATFQDDTRLVANVRTQGASYVEKVDVDVVQVPVIVTDGGRFVDGLPRSAFVVREDGVPQHISFLAAEDSPLEITIAIDVSGSMADAMDGVKAAAKRFLAALRPGDAVTILGFNDTVFTLAKNATDSAEMMAAIDELSAWGGTALYDAAIKAIDMLGRRPGRKALVMFTDGEDRVSRMTLDDARARLEATNVMFYAIAQGRAIVMPTLRRTLETIAGTSGGRAFFEREGKNLDVAFNEIVSELRHHYMLAYAPTNTARDAGWRKIDVQLADKVAGRKYRLRAREGYRAPAPAGSRP
jgi:Ca-activated chloride channel family protein